MEHRVKEIFMCINKVCQNTKKVLLSMRTYQKYTDNDNVSIIIICSH